MRDLFSLPLPSDLTGLGDFRRSVLRMCLIQWYRSWPKMLAVHLTQVLRVASGTVVKKAKGKREEEDGEGEEDEGMVGEDGGLARRLLSVLATLGEDILGK